MQVRVEITEEEMRKLLMRFKDELDSNAGIRDAIRKAIEFSLTNSGITGIDKEKLFNQLSNRIGNEVYQFLKYEVWKSIEKEVKKTADKLVQEQIKRLTAEGKLNPKDLKVDGEDLKTYVKRILESEVNKKLESLRYDLEKELDKWLKVIEEKVSSLEREIKEVKAKDVKAREGTEDKPNQAQLAQLVVTESFVNEVSDKVVEIVGKELEGRFKTFELTLKDLGKKLRESEYVLKRYVDDRVRDLRNDVRKFQIDSLFNLKRTVDELKERLARIESVFEKLDNIDDIPVAVEAGDSTKGKGLWSLLTALNSLAARGGLNDSCNFSDSECLDDEKGRHKTKEDVKINASIFDNPEIRSLIAAINSVNTLLVPRGIYLELVHVQSDRGVVYFKIKPTYEEEVLNSLWVNLVVNTYKLEELFRLWTKKPIEVRIINDLYSMRFLKPENGTKIS